MAAPYPQRMVEAAPRVPARSRSPGPLRGGAGALPSSARGFTLLEAIVVMGSVGIIAATVAVFIPKPVEGYMATTSRLNIADIADTALRRIGRDVRLALPNTVRVDATGMFLELIPIKAGGRYRDNDACFATGCTSLSTLGDMLTNVQLAPGSDLVAIFNTYNNSGNDCSATLISAYCSAPSPQNTATLTSASGAGTTSNTLNFASIQFQPPGGSPTRRVFIIPASPVTYACDAATGTLWRFSGYARTAAQPASMTSAVLLAAASKSALATGVTCPAVVAGSVPPRFSYTAGASERYGLLSAWITVQANGETISLLHQIHVDNTP
jgi:MSHA biogenesis protein MshO